MMSAPELLREELASYGVAAASHGFSAGKPFEAFGEVLSKVVAGAAGPGFGEEAAAAWAAAYSDASLCMQGSYSLGQLEEAEKATGEGQPAEEGE